MSMSCGIQCLCLPHLQLQQTELFCRAGPVRPRHLAWLWPWDGCRARCLVPCCGFLMTSQGGKSHCFVQDTFARAVGSTQGGDCSTWFLTVTVTSLPHQTQGVSPGVWVHGLIFDCFNTWPAGLVSISQHLGVCRASGRCWYPLSLRRAALVCSYPCNGGWRPESPDDSRG